MIEISAADTPKPTWHTIPGEDGNAILAVRSALEAFDRETSPTPTEDNILLKVGCCPVRLLRVTRTYKIEDLGLVDAPQFDQVVQ